MKKYLAILLVILFSRDVSAHMRITMSSGLNPRWASMPVPYWINEKGSPNIPNGSEFSAIQSSFQTWQNIQTANIQFAYKGTTNVGTVGVDGMNVVTFTDTTVPLGSSTIAATFSFFKNQNGELLFEETDVAFNPAMDFSTSAESNKFDVQSVLTHEIGHVLGLDHSGLVSSVMVPFGVASQLDQRTLTYDDIAGVMEIYPNSAAMPSTGQIDGTIQSGTVPVFGAHVIAIDSTGTAITSTLSQRDGKYILRYLPPDAYRIAVEPLDGPVTLQHIGGTNGFYSASNTSFGSTFFGNVSTLAEATAVGVGPGDDATANIQIFPASSSGLNLTRPAFGVRMARGRTTALTGTIGGVDLSSGVVFATSSRDVQFGPVTFGGRVSATAPTSISVQITTLASAALGPKILAVNRGTDASFVGGAFVITDSPPSNISVGTVSGPIDGNTLLSVRGSDFRPGAQVYFAGLPATNVQVIDSGTIIARTPANSPGVVNVVVFNADGTWGVGRQIFTYIAEAPQISRVSPLTGPRATEVVIEGNNFDSRSQNIDVRFNGSSARVVNATTDTITAVVPFGATTGPITVTVFGQTATGPEFTVTASATSTNFAAQTFKFIDASTANGGTALNFISNDDGIKTVDLPFDFVLFRDIYLAGSRISVGINGYLSLEPVSLDEFQNTGLPARTVNRTGSAAGTIGNVPPSLIAPFWDDLVMHSDSALTSKTVGVAPNRQFIVEWSNLSILDEFGKDLNASLTFEAVLYEGTNDIQFLYSNVNGPRSDGSSATVGMQNLKRDLAVQTGFNQAIIANGFFTTYRFLNGTYSDALPDTTPAEVKIIPSAPQDGTKFTGVALLASSPMSVTLNALDSNGNLIGGSGVQNPITVTLSASQQYTKVISEFFGLQSFDGWIEADASATGLGIFLATGTLDMRHLDGATISGLSPDFLLFHAGAAAILVNPSSRVANVTLTGLATGTSQTVTIAPRNRFVTTLLDVTRIQSSEPLSAVERLSATGSLASSGVAPTSQAQSTLVFPDAIVGSGYSSVMTIANVGTTEQTATINFGNLTATLTIGANRAIRGSIADLLHVPQDATTAGAVRVTASSASLTGVLDVQKDGDTAITPARSPQSVFTIPNTANGNGFFTGLAFASGNVPANITLEVYSATGKLVGSAGINLGSNGQLTKLLAELVPAAANQVGGYIRIRSDHPIWTWEIFGSGQAIASAPPL